MSSSLPYSLWWCPACNRGLGNDHRKCVFTAFNFDGTAWEKACIATGTERARKYLVELSEESSTWLKKTHKYAILPPGRYYIGDISNALWEEYANVFEASDHASGCYTNGQKVFVVAPTLRSRGTYNSSTGDSYYVETGFIGIVSQNLFESEPSGGTIHTFTEPVEVRFEEKGVFEFVSGPQKIIIDTSAEW
jgi:hypothetical protein